ncbi:MAG: hypothetical protein Q8Q09_23700 [Deltaproteobacteria bacterium]|nr:hypothetical protein [Deltaproteobacteria bacterium]
MQHNSQLVASMGLALALITTCAQVSYAQARAETPATRPAVVGEEITFQSVRTVRRNRWSQTLAWGMSAGIGGPLGLVGTFVEYRPVRYVGVSAGVGGGGTFGPSLAASLLVTPLSLKSFALGVSADVSSNLSLLRGRVLPGQRGDLPSTSTWIGVGGHIDIRPSRSFFIRVGGGYQWLMDVQRFNVATDAEISALSLSTAPLLTPFDAARAAARNESFGVPFVRLELGTYWSL